MTGQDRTYRKLELGCTFRVSLGEWWIKFQCDKGAEESQAPRLGGALVNGSCPWCHRARRAALPLPASTLPTFLCAASSSQGSLCQSSQERPETAAQDWLLSTKSKAFPAEGVAHLTLYRSEAPRIAAQSLEKAPSK